MVSLSGQLLEDQRFAFASAACRENGKSYDFAVVEMEGYEALSRPFRFTLTLVSEEVSVDFDAMLSNTATFRIFSPDGSKPTPYHGILSEFVQLHSADGYVFYKAVLVPRLWNLSLYRVSEVYVEEQPITDTFKKVFGDGMLSSRDFEFRLTGKYRALSFVCQFEETHLDFLSRWMEREGIYYYFDHQSGSDRLIAVDSLMMHDKKQESEQDECKVVAIVYRPDDRMDTGTSGDSVRTFVGSQRPLPMEVILQEFNHRKAALPLKVSAAVSENGRGHMMLYGEDFRDEEEGRRYAKIRAEELISGGKIFSGDGTAVGLRAGYFAVMSGHYRTDFNGEYLVTEVHHRGSQAGALLTRVRSHDSGNVSGGEISYSNSFMAIPSGVQFRPARSTPKPRVAGTMSAVVDSEGTGEYAELDEFGQYKVQLPFDLTDKPENRGSARVRMSTPYSGSDHGMHFPLLKGSEVLLSFADGDPDRPVIVGAVPNSQNLSVVNNSNPHDNVIATRGGNQMLMADTAGKQAIWLNSPFKNTSIGVGAIGIGASSDESAGGIFAATRGNIDLVTFGQSNNLAFGSSNSLSMGTSSAVTAGFSNSVSFGAKLGIAVSSDVLWQAGKSVIVNDQSVVKLTNGKEATRAFEKITLAAGSPDHSDKVKEIEGKMTIARATLGIFLSAYMAAGAATAAAINGDMPGPSANAKKAQDGNRAAREESKKNEIAQANAEELSDDDKKAEHDELEKIDKSEDSQSEKDDKSRAVKEKYQEKLYDQRRQAVEGINEKYAAMDSPMNNLSFVNGWPGVFTKAVGETFVDGLALMGLQSYVGGLASKIEDLDNELRSKIELDGDALVASHTNTTKHREEKLMLSRGGVDLSHASTAGGGSIFSSKLILDDKEASIERLGDSGAQSAKLELTDDSAKLESAKRGLVLMDKDAVKLTRGGTVDGVVLTDSDGTLRVGKNSVLITEDKSELKFGDVGAVTLSKTGSTLTFESCKVSLRNSGVSVGAINGAGDFASGVLKVGRDGNIFIG